MPPRTEGTHVYFAALGGRLLTVYLDYAVKGYLFALDAMTYPELEPAIPSASV